VLAVVLSHGEIGGTADGGARGSEPVTGVHVYLGAFRVPELGYQT
jgi:hypothetical protein